MGRNKKHITASEHRVVHGIPWSETCFGCNGGANEGLGLRLWVTEDGYIYCAIRTKRCHQGFPDVVHGGIVAAYFDEVLWGETLISAQGCSAMTVEINVKYFQPVGLEQDIRIVAKPARIDGRHIYVDGYLLLSDDTIAASAAAHYIVVKKTDTLTGRETARIKYYEHPTSRTVWF